MEIVEESVVFPGPVGDLHGVLAYPATGRPHHAALVCAPHPHFAGTADNPVVVHLARALASGRAVLRFDYRGVGASALPAGVDAWAWWQAVERDRAYDEAIADVGAARAFLAGVVSATPLIAGYSFGACVGARSACEQAPVTGLALLAPPLARVDFAFLHGWAGPCLLGAGDGDFACTPADLAALASALPAASILPMPGADHFLRGDEAAIAEGVAAWADGVEVPC